jgi:imidazolonepropionase-like amidohydrolase
MVPARLCDVSDRLGTVETGKIANLTVVQGDSYFDPENKVREVWIDGRVYSVNPGATKSGEMNEPANAEAAAEPKTKEATSSEDKRKKELDLRELRKKRLAHSPIEGRKPLAEPPALIVEGASIWTCGPPGKLENADLLIEQGKIKAVGQGLRSRFDISGSALVVDGRGKHVTPGIIDAHNHSIALGAVNEATLPSTAMVRMGDVVNSESVNIHKQGVSDRIGSIEVGKEATIFAADGSILDIRSNVKRMWIAGKEVSLESRHTRLYEKYKARPRAQ